MAHAGAALPLPEPARASGDAGRREAEVSEAGLEAQQKAAVIVSDGDSQREPAGLRNKNAATDAVIDGVDGGARPAETAGAVSARDTPYSSPAVHQSQGHAAAEDLEATPSRQIASPGHHSPPFSAAADVGQAGSERLLEPATAEPAGFELPRKPVANPIPSPRQDDPAGGRRSVLSFAASHGHDIATARPAIGKQLDRRVP
eukprot:scaffold277506_cov37-Prasinocladus_malaysianus.AAC.1